MPILRGVQIDQPLGHEGRFGASRAALRAERDFVGEGGVNFAEAVGDVIRPGDAAPHHGGGDAGSNRRGVRAEIGVAGAAQRRDFAVARASEDAMLLVIAPLHGRAHVTVARIDPLDRAAQFMRQEQDQRHIRVDVALRAETAADRRRNHAHFVERDVEDVVAQDQAVVVRRLRAGVERVVAFDRVEGRQRAARLNRAVDGALVEDVDVYDDFGISNRLIGRFLYCRTSSRRSGCAGLPREAAARLRATASSASTTAGRTS